jgi:hypothetical protein
MPVLLGTGFIEGTAVMSTTTAVVLVDDPLRTEAIAVAGFLAGYCGSTRRSYATDLRLFSAWCQEAQLPLFSVRRAHLELFGRWMEESGRTRSTVARRLSTLAKAPGLMVRRLMRLPGNVTDWPHRAHLFWPHLIERQP